MYQKILQSELIILLLAGTVNHCFMASPPQQLLGGLVRENIRFLPIYEKKACNWAILPHIHASTYCKFCSSILCCIYVNING